MNWLFFLLGIITVAANATMDELRFHYDRVFGYIAKPGTKLAKWVNPTISWYNKYKFKNSVFNFIYGSVCVWFTDFWHLLKAIFLNAIFSIIILFISPDADFKEFISGLLLFNVFWGFVFESTLGVYGVLSDYVKKKNGELH